MLRRMAVWIVLPLIYEGNDQKIICKHLLSSRHSIYNECIVVDKPASFPVIMEFTILLEKTCNSLSRGDM